MLTILYLECANQNSEDPFRFSGLERKSWRARGLVTVAACITRHATHTEAVSMTGVYINNMGDSNVWASARRCRCQGAKRIHRHLLPASEIGSLIGGLDGRRVHALDRTVSSRVSQNADERDCEHVCANARDRKPYRRTTKHMRSRNVCRASAQRAQSTKWDFEGVDLSRLYFRRGELPPDDRKSPNFLAPDSYTNAD